MAGIDSGRIGGLGADHVAHLGRDHFGAGRHRFGGYYDDGLDCPYDLNYTPSNWPNSCSY
jgi:hypothetical protein